jgi:hypothetical protein
MPKFVLKYPVAVPAKNVWIDNIFRSLRDIVACGMLGHGACFAGIMGMV